MARQVVCCATALSLLLSGGGPVQGEALPANAWVPIDEAKGEAFAPLVRHLQMISGAPKGQYDNWLFQAKRGRFSSTAEGVWDPTRKRAFFVSGRLSETWSYDPATGGSWGDRLGPREAPRGWMPLKPAGDSNQGSLRWAALCRDPVNDELVLFGGNSRDDRGSPDTFVYSPAANAWRRLDFSGLPLFKPHAECERLFEAVHQLSGRLRSRWHVAETADEAKADLGKIADDLAGKVAALQVSLTDAAVNEAEREQVAWAIPELEAARAALQGLAGAGGAAAPDRIAAAAAAAEHLRMARDWLAVEPPPRANSPLAYDPTTKQMVLFGGDHFDCLMSDTWTYDCTTRRWRQRRPSVVPDARAGHALVPLPKSGRVALVGGYAYVSEEGYSAADYWIRPLELWLYDPAAHAWALTGRWELTKGKGQRVDGGPTSPRQACLLATADTDDTIVAGGWVCRVDASAADAKGAAEFGVPAGTVRRRTGKYEPAWWDQALPPDAQACEKALTGLPANTWVAVTPPKVLGRNRDWGTATFDTDRLQVLFFSGGHCAYSGTDVAMYSTRANRWRISAVAEMPIEFCRGTGYHGQEWSFGGRPWMSSHTYKLYAYDPKVGKMICSNRSHTFLFDPLNGDWEWPPIVSPFAGGWVPKFLTTPDGVVVWAPVRTGGRDAPGALWRFDGAARDWRRIETSGEAVPPTPNDDYGGIAYDSKRNRVLLFASDRRSTFQAGWACDLSSGEVTRLETANAKVGPRFCREAIYLPKGDLVLFGTTFGNAKAGEGRVTASVYDVAANRFRGLVLTTPDRGKDGRPAYGGHGIGLMYDPKRDLAWTVDQNWAVRVMRFDRDAAVFAEE